MRARAARSADDRLGVWGGIKPRDILVDCSGEEMHALGQKGLCRRQPTDLQQLLLWWSMTTTTTTTRPLKLAFPP